MEKLKNKWRAHRRADSIESLLEDYYGQLLKWGAILTRGDAGMTHDIVHDLCLHFTLAKPDLSQVANLDGYLYTCLRNIYVSTLARSSREATQFVDVADFDSIHFALRAGSSDHLLDQQNDLRRICSYAAWRKETSKSASYLILLFFHGYSRREVAQIACLPIAAIYNKLKVARTEAKAYLDGAGKLRIATRDLPPAPAVRHSPVSLAELLHELRQVILQSHTSDCVSEEELLLHYRSPSPTPLPCSLLSHIVSCTRCLSLIDRYFNRPRSEDREPPDDAWDSRDEDSNGLATDGEGGYHAMMSLVRRQRDRIYEHRPRTLSIAFNGRIVAFHDVQSARSTLASRAERPENVQFVEVFTDQRIRLALLPIEDLPPEGLHVHTQTVTLSDERQLELQVSFDGQGLHSEVTYLDPALAAETADEEDDIWLAAQPTEPVAGISDRPANRKSESIGSRIVRFMHVRTQRFVLAWAMLLVAVLGGAGYLAYRYTHPSLDARAILNDSIRNETALAKGVAEHQVLQVQALAAGGQTVWQGTVDLWQEPAGGRTMRRLYNAQHRLLAAQWNRKNGQSGSYIAPAGDAVSQTDHEIAESGFWKVGISARAFLALAARQMKVRTAGGDYELTGTGLSNGPSHLVSAMLILDRHLHLVGETLRVNNGYRFTEVRFVEAGDERVPAASVPNSVFDPSGLDSGLRNHSGGSTADDGIGHRFGGTDTKLVQTEVAVLYRLNELGADVGEPIQITRTPASRIRVAGTVASSALKKQIAAALENIPNRQLLEINLVAQGSLRIPVPPTRLTAPVTHVYNVAHAAPPADTILRKYFTAKGLTGKQIDSAIAQFSRQALDHAQRALQDAYALDRLGTSFSAEELRAMGPISQQQWSTMAAQHSLALKTEFDELQQQIAQLALEGSPLPVTHQVSPINSPADFAGSARTLLADTQKLNRAVGSAFSSGLAGADTRSAESSIDAVLQSIPLSSAEQLADFTSRLSNARANAKDTANLAGEQYPESQR